jgi:ATP-dependent Lhr-like helicase
VALLSFHPAVREWFGATFGEPTPPQHLGWPRISAGCSTLIAAPTGSGKTLAAFLWAIDGLLRQGSSLPGQTSVVYVSPLRALVNDIRKNLQGPLREIRALDPALPELRVLVRTGDTPAAERSRMRRLPPHILVTTPESLYILLSSDGGRDMLRTARTVIVDEIHALVRDKRGSHLALSLERLEALAGRLQRIGLSATQKPLQEMARFLVGAGRDCACVDVGWRRDLDLSVEVPPSPLSAVCAHEVWGEIYARIAGLIEEHRTTLVFVNTRKLAERLAARLTERLGAERVTCHHSSLSRDRRLDAENRLKEGGLRALVATASLELGIDIGEVDLAIQVGSCRSIATLLQRVGRSGHGPGRVPRGRLFPLTLDELVEAAALLRAVRRGELDRTPIPDRPLDVLAQQIVAEVASRTWDEDQLFQTVQRAWPYRDLSRAEFDSVVALHTGGRHGLLHRDGVGGRLRGRRRARLAAVTCGGAIPDVAEYQVLLEPEGTFLGTLDEDFAIESSAGDVFQLGNSSWRVLKVEPGTVRVADARGAPPTVPFWFGEAPARTDELCAGISRLREECTGADWLRREAGLSPEAAEQIAAYLDGGRRSLGAVPTQQCVVAERFFDESGGMQLVIHAPFGRRINRAWGLALRKRFCRGFGFELQAAANDEAIVISLAAHHSFPLESVFDFLHPDHARDLLVQALLPAPMFASRWRWNVTRSLVVERMQGGRRVPPPILRMRAQDRLAAAFPGALACPETLEGPDVPVPMEHPLVRQTIEDCLTEAMDVQGFLGVIQGLHEGRIERRAVDLPQPSAFARGILAAQPHSFLDDAPLEERRTQAVMARRVLSDPAADDLGALDPRAVERVRSEAWPQPQSAEEVHEALLWMGFVTAAEAESWRCWIEELRQAGRVVAEDGRLFAVEATRDPVEVWRGRLEALGPVFDDEPALEALQARGDALRVRLEGRWAWCERRLLARIHRYTLDALRREIEPVPVPHFLRFLARWQHVHEEDRLDGPRGMVEAVRQLAGVPLPAVAWERSVLPARVRDYRREWLDSAGMSGEVVWGRLWGGGAGPIRTVPVCLVMREDLDSWLALADPPGEASGAAADVAEALRRRGPMFLRELARVVGLPGAWLEKGLAELIAAGVVTCDSFAGLRQLLVSPSRRGRHRGGPGGVPGRWSLFRDRVAGGAAAPPAEAAGPEPGVRPDTHEFAARQLLRRTGVVMRRTAQREKHLPPWSALVRVYRRLELRGEVRGGRFVAGPSGEQYALPEAVDLLRRVRRQGAADPPVLPVGDPADYAAAFAPPPPVSDGG